MFDITFSHKKGSQKEAYVLPQGAGSGQTQISPGRLAGPQISGPSQ
jgi:hypothetical protein